MKHSWMIGCAAVVLTTSASPIATAAEDESCIHTRRHGARPPASGTRALSSAPVVMLDRHGGRLSGGWDDAAGRSSDIVASEGLRSLSVPSFSGSNGDWSRLMSCVQGHFEPFDVVITDEAPRSGSFLRVMVGGKPSMLGFSGHIAGVAPYTGQVIDDGIAFVFEGVIRDGTELCEATAHEAGHMLGLDHSTLCTDLMSYQECGPKRFVDEAAACGEFGSRSCGGGSRQQNSFQELASGLGLRHDPAPPAPTPQPEPIPPSGWARVDPRRDDPSRPASPPRSRGPRAEPESPRQGGGGWWDDDDAPRSRDRGRDRDRDRRSDTPRRRPDPQRPRVAVASLPQRADANSTYHVSLDAMDDDGIAAVELLWSDGRSVTQLRCGRIDRSLPARCWRRGSTYTFALEVGSGSRSFAIKVTDGRGHTTVTKTRRVRFS